MADNVTFQTGTLATAPNATAVRTKDRSGVETQIAGLDLNPGGSSEQLMTSPDANLPARIKDLDSSIRDLILALTNSPMKDSFDRVQVYLCGGTTTVGVSTLTSVTNPVYQSSPGGFLPPPLFQVLSDQAWANVRLRIN